MLGGREGLEELRPRHLLAGEVPGPEAPQAWKKYEMRDPAPGGAWKALEGPQGGLGAGLRSASEKNDFEVLCDLPEGLGYLILGRPDGLLASSLPGVPRSPQLPAGLELCRPPEGFGLRAASPAGFGAFALLDGPGLTQFRDFCSLWDLVNDCNWTYNDTYIGA